MRCVPALQRRCDSSVCVIERTGTCSEAHPPGEKGAVVTDKNGTWRIALVDDEADIREVLGVSLEDAGYEVATASDGETGLQLCRSFQPHILITDIRMPGMDGLQLLEAVKRSQPEIEVIVATGFGEMQVAIRALQLDASDFVTKPVGEEALQLALRRARERYTGRKQLADHARLLEEESVQTTQELLRTISFQRRLIHSSMDGILGCDQNETAVTYNQALERMVGYPRHQVLWRKRLSDFLAQDDAGALRHALEGESFGGPGRLFLYETRLLTAEGRSVPVQVSATEILEGDRRDGLVFFFRDLRDIHRLEREMADQAKILHQDKMMSLGRLAASVVHEINNPLSGILNYARLMKRILERGRPDDEQLEKFRRHLELIDTETSRCSRIVSNLLSFSRHSRIEFTDVDIRELLERSALLSRHKLELQNVTLDVATAPDLPRVRGDANQLQQCIINLVFNALDAMPQGGRLELSATPESTAVVVRVRDTGPGIDPDILAHIFEPFFTTKKEGHGTGLGLSTVYGIVERHGGTVDVHSRPGDGTAFTITLPAGTAGPVPSGGTMHAEE